MPSLLIRQKRIVKPIQQPRRNQSHLRIGQVLPHAVTRAKAKGLESLTVVAAEPGLVQGVGGGEPALGAEGVGVGEVLGVPECGPWGYGDASLREGLATTIRPELQRNVGCSYSCWDVVILDKVSR